MTQAKPDKTHRQQREGTRDGTATVAVRMPWAPYIRGCACLGRPLDLTNCLALTPPAEIGTADSVWRHSLVGGLRTMTSDKGCAVTARDALQAFCQGMLASTPGRGGVVSEKHPGICCANSQVLQWLVLL